MTEKEASAPPGDPSDQQKPLFVVTRGAYGDRIHYDIPTEAPASFEIPERPRRLEEMTAEEMILVALSDRLTPDIYSHFSDKRADFIRNHNWTPYSDSEATRSIGGGLVNYLLGARDRGGMVAVRDVLNAVDQDRSTAVHAISELELVKDPQSGEFQPELARENTLVRQTLARAVLARNSLNLYQWPRHYDKREKEVKENEKTAKLLMSITDRLARLDDETMSHLLQKTYAHQQARLAFMAKETDKAREDEKTADLVAAARTRA